MVALAAVVSLGIGVAACALEVGGLLADPASASSSGSGTGGDATSSSSAASTASSGGGGGGGGVAEGKTCLEIRDKAASRQTSRVYLLDPDGPGGEDPFEAYCEMIEDGGGFTLALKIDGTKSTFEYSEALWENSDTYQPDSPDLDAKEAKLKSFSMIGFKELRLGMIDNTVPHWILVPLPFAPPPSLKALFSASNSVSTNVMESTWRALLESPSLQTYCKKEGFNIASTKPQNARVRIGILGNDQDECDSSDSLIGFGANKDFGGPSGNFAKDSPDNGNRTTKTFGYVLVR